MQAFFGWSVGFWSKEWSPVLGFRDQHRGGLGVNASLWEYSFLAPRGNHKSVSLVVHLSFHTCVPEWLGFLVCCWLYWVQACLLVGFNNQETVLSQVSSVAIPHTLPVRGLHNTFGGDVCIINLYITLLTQDILSADALSIVYPRPPFVHDEWTLSEELRSCRVGCAWVFRWFLSKRCPISSRIWGISRLFVLLALCCSFLHQCRFLISGNCTSTLLT